MQLFNEKCFRPESFIKIAVTYDKVRSENDILL